MTGNADAIVMIVCGLALVAAVTVAQAQTLVDPTRPPATVENPAPGDGENQPATGLQIIIRSNCGTPAAIVNGEYVLLGGHVGDARVVAIGEDSITLKSAAGKETLKLMPGIEKTPAKSGAGEAEKKGLCAKASPKKPKK